MNIKEIIIVAKVLVIDNSGLILTLRRSADDPIRPSEWDLPGGSVDFGEDPTSAVIREATEEAGLQLVAPQIFTTITTDDKRYVIRLLYYAIVGTPAVTLSHEHDAYNWVSRQQFLDLDIPDYYKRCLHLIQIGKP